MRKSKARIVIEIDGDTLTYHIRNYTHLCKHAVTNDVLRALRRAEEQASFAEEPRRPFPVRPEAV